MNVLKAAVAVGAAAVTLLGTKAAFAGNHGVVFIHGTGDYPGTMTCAGANCSVSNASSGYWTPGEISSIANGRPYAVVGFDGGTCAPWPQSGDSTYGHTSTGGSCPLSTSTGNADVIVSQIVQFMNNDSITDIVMVTHSGGSNQARYILQNYTRSSGYTTVKNATKRVVTAAGTTLGTYLANEVFGGAVTSLIGGLVSYGGEGVNLLRTNYISTYNGASGYFGGINNPVSGVNFYATGGVSGSTCYGVTLFGACIGVSGQTLGGSSCDSLVDDVGLLSLHDLYLDYNDPSTNRNSCSDGFISCSGSQRLGNTFGYSEKQDHNQSRRQCNGLDVQIRNTVSGAESGFADWGEVSSQVAPKQLDACGFGTYAPVTNSHGSTIAWTEGCTASQLGNGNCDWDCIALYGNDAVVTQWDSTGTKPLAWGASDCTATTNSYGGTTYVDTSTSPWAEHGTYTNSGGTQGTQFNGYTCTGTSSQCGGHNPSSSDWFYDPNYGSSTLSAGYCPQSWIGDGTCDECVMALYGSDGNDCAPGHIVQCGGIVTTSQPYQGSNYYYYNNAIYNEGTPSSGGSTWLEWQSMSASAGDGICQNTECTAAVSSSAYYGTDQCGSNSDCASGSTCVNGGCTTNGSDCSATFAVTPRGCATNADCTGNACEASTGTCLLTGGACTTDANCPIPGGATSTCGSGGVCSCSTSADCSGGATCTSGTCALTVTTSLCR